MPTPIIVPLDRSELAEEALPLAAGVAVRLHRPLQLTLVHTGIPMLPEAGPTGMPDLDARLWQDEHAYLLQVGSRLERKTGVAVNTTILEGPVAPTLIAHARSNDADLVVMSTHGRGGLNRLFLGSVADRLIRELHCPLVLVHAGCAPATPHPEEQRRILIPLDGSALAESIIDRVLTAFGADHLVLDLVQVVPPSHELFTGGSAPLTVPTHLEQHLLVANRYLHAVATRLRQLGLTVHIQTRVDSSVPHAILRHADEHQSHLIAVATRGLGGLERMLLGSVADKLVRGASVPLLVWNPPPPASSKTLFNTVGALANPSLAVAAR
jgi:nucleotide-binding universal stress UspA family protein